MVADSDHPSIPARRLAERLRDLREREYKQLTQKPSPLTQKQLAKVLGGAETLSIATVSLWEKPGSNRLPPPPRLATYARLFCTSRSFEAGPPRLLRDDELTEHEQQREAELYAELLALRERAQSTGPAAPPAREQRAPERRSSLWSVPDGHAVSIVCSDAPAADRPSYADPSHLNYSRYARYADLDALVEVYGQVKADNPGASIIRLLSPHELARDFALNYLIVVGGAAVYNVAPYFAQDIPLPQVEPIPGTDTHVFKCRVGDEVREFTSTRDDDGALVEDIGLIARGLHASVPGRTVTMLSGITSRGVHGAALGFINRDVRDENEEYLRDTFRNANEFCIVMRVSVIQNAALPSNLSRDDVRLYEWSSETGARW
jgi:transcriptional regulator with XRE-family HTH domain